MFKIRAGGVINIKLGMACIIFATFATYYLLYGGANDLFLASLILSPFFSVFKGLAFIALLGAANIFVGLAFKKAVDKRRYLDSARLTYIITLLFLLAFGGYLAFEYLKFIS